MRPVFELQQSAYEVDELWSLAKLGWAHRLMNKRSKAEARQRAEINASMPKGR